MKKYYTTKKYKRWNNKKSTKGLKKRNKSYTLNKSINASLSTKTNTLKKKEVNIIAPKDCLLIHNTSACLLFFRKLKEEKNYFIKNKRACVKAQLCHIEKLDYAFVSTLLAVIDYLKCKEINFIGDIPKSKVCREDLIKSGYLNNLYTSKGQRFQKVETSDSILFETGGDDLLFKKNQAIGKIIKKTVYFLTGQKRHFLPLKTVILEVCGNSIEWAGNKKNRWFLCAKYEDDKVIFTAIDIGKGILKTLYRKYDKKLIDFINMSDELDVLRGAFNKKYGSSTKQKNRNKGLPSIKQNYITGNIENLKVLTNNVMLHFDNNTLSCKFGKGKPHFNGTFYQWEITKKCLTQKIYE